MTQWILENSNYNEQTHLHDAPVYTLGNGLLGCRGFFEEIQNGIAGLGGIYMANIFGKGAYSPWSGEPRELVNIPNFFSVSITINDNPLIINSENLLGFNQTLNMLEGTLKRNYIYKENNKQLCEFTFTRFISQDNLFLAGQSIEITPLADNLKIKIACDINTNITNLNEESCEPWPIQPGRKHYQEISRNHNAVGVKISEPDEIILSFAQNTDCSNGTPVLSDEGHEYIINSKQGETTTIKKLVAISTSAHDDGDTLAISLNRLNSALGFDTELHNHVQAMKNKWQNADIIISGSAEDQRSLRYNILQLMQSYCEHSSVNSIGARGLTGEMYEGCVFWDTEIFMLPFFSLTNPQCARNLLNYRYNTLPQAKQHAKNNWFEGAMYGWQVNNLGEEQTPVGVGAYYSIHVIADISYAILDYWYTCQDEDFILEKGLEILIETSRFWASRVTLTPESTYDIMAVRGPNEYDVLVNNNLYTNMMARENLILCIKLLESLNSNKVDEIRKKLNLQNNEIEQWVDISEKIVLPYDEKSGLWLEDDTYLRRRPLDMNRAKPTGKRIIDTTIPYEALPMYQVTKQADVLHAMKNLPWYFTKEDIQTAYDFYYPKTAFDSSLSYSMFALMSAKMGNTQIAYKHFLNTMNLDLNNIQLNTISGLHFANFGGTWQAMVFGFCGVSVHEDYLSVEPNLPKEWDFTSFKLNYRNGIINFKITHNTIEAELLSDTEKPIKVKLNGHESILDCKNKNITEVYNEQQNI